jgi:NADH-quinone oxidoreductase subunit G
MPKKPVKPKAKSAAQPGKAVRKKPELKAKKGKATPKQLNTAAAEHVAAKLAQKVTAMPPQAAAAPKAPPAAVATAPAAPALPPAPEGFVNVFVDGVLLQVKKGSTVMAACTQAGKEIPHFCYHERLSIAGNCRMCLIEIEGMPKPVASCHWPVAEGNKIRTDSKLTIEARKGTMEMLLINHPLDCPICDQGGECDLQDQAVAYGADRSHYHEFKRAVDDKDIGSKIKTVMTRCIHCTRCIRFATEVAGVEEFGATGRGENMQVGTYVEAALQSELAGNMIDLCPVGALTSKPYAFAGRPWELVDTHCIDILDGVGAHLTVQSRAGQVMRVLPREADAINEEWITDAARFSYDALHTNRLVSPHADEGQHPRPLGWQDAFSMIKTKLAKVPPQKIAGTIGTLQGAEDAFAMREFFYRTLGSKNLALDGATITDPAFLRGYTPFKQWEQADAVLIIGANPRLEAPLLNARLRKLIKKRVPIALLGAQPEKGVDLTYKYEHLGDNPTLLTGKHPFLTTLGKAQRPLVILGRAALDHPSAESIFAIAHKLAQRGGWNGYNFLTPTSGTLAPLALGYDTPASKIIKSIEKNDIEVLFLHGECDSIATSLLHKFKGISIYLGTHSTPQAQACTLQLPTASWAEKSFTSINIQGDIQVSNQAIMPPHLAKEDWKIYRALSEHLGKIINFDTLNQLRSQMGQLNTGKFSAESGKISSQPLTALPTKYYLQNSYLRQSSTMQSCQKESGSPTAQKAKAIQPFSSTQSEEGAHV